MVHGRIRAPVSYPKPLAETGVIQFRGCGACDHNSVGARDDLHSRDKAEMRIGGQHNRADLPGTAADDHVRQRQRPPLPVQVSGQVIYYGRQRERCGDAEPSPARIFPALDFLAALCTHIPDTGQQLVRYYGAFSHVRRAQAGARVSDSPAVPPPGNEDGGRADEFTRQVRSSWARLIKKVYEADPLVCPRCSGRLKIISLIGDGPVIEKILRHLKLWDRQERPPPPPAERSIQYDEDISGFDEGSQWPDASG